MKLRALATCVVCIAACGGEVARDPTQNGDAGVDPDASMEAGPWVMTCGSAACVDLAGDATSCGACGHDCQGGECSAGVCQPVVLASNLSHPSSIAVDDANVYWTDDSGVKSCDVHGCGNQPVTLAISQTALGLAIDLTSVYWTEASGVIVLRAPSGLPHRGEPDQRVLGHQTHLMTCPVTGCSKPPMSLTPYDPQLQDIAVDAENVYLASCHYSGGSLTKCAVGGCNNQAIPVEQGRCASSVVVDDAAVYWAEDTGVMQCARGGCNGQPSTFATSTLPVWDLATDSVNVYWTDGANPVMKCGVVGCNNHPTTLVTGPSSAGRRIAVHGPSVYWTDATAGTVMKIAK